ncbi:MAG: histidine phosphatase family protein [Patescibacteria group bacterium]|nr:histidine phosphatase family protein [Patescibacteria group bacterium]
MAKLILLRHFKSQWNLENRFTGWVDVPLVKNKSNKEKLVSKKIFNSKIDVIYSSPLFRNQNSVIKILEYSNKAYPIFIHLDKGKMKDRGNFKDVNKKYIPVYISENLNERYYGKLQGENKAEMIEKYGQEKVHLWRRGFKNRPPFGESLEDTFKRAVPFYRKYIEKDLKNGKNVLIVASHNSLRALIKHIEKISDKEIINLEIAYAGSREYEFDKFLKVKSKT